MAAPKPAIVLIHGLWMTPLCWEDWVKHFEAKGYEVIAPGWPGVDNRTPAEIRADPKSIADKSIANIVDHYAGIIEKLPTPPIIMGHSFGGLFVQILLNRGYGAAGIAVSPAQPAGIFALPFSTIKAGFPILSNPFDYKSTVKISESEFHYCFGNHLDPAESKKLWERYSIPSVCHVLWEGALGLLNSGPSNASHVQWDKPDRAPLLLIAGSNDHVVTHGTVEKEYKAYKGPAKVEFKLFEGRSHGIVNQAGWEEVADYGLAFAEANKK